MITMKLLSFLWLRLVSAMGSAGFAFYEACNRRIIGRAASRAYRMAFLEQIPYSQGIEIIEMRIARLRLVFPSDTPALQELAAWHYQLLKFDANK